MKIKNVNAKNINLLNINITSDINRESSKLSEQSGKNAETASSEQNFQILLPLLSDCRAAIQSSLAMISSILLLPNLTVSFYLLTILNFNNYFYFIIFIIFFLASILMYIFSIFYMYKISMFLFKSINIDNVHTVIIKYNIRFFRYIIISISSSVLSISMFVYGISTLAENGILIIRK